jgi:hypothetical protein
MIELSVKDPTLGILGPVSQNRENKMRSQDENSTQRKQQ